MYVKSHKLIFVFVSFGVVTKYVTSLSFYDRYLFKDSKRTLKLGNSLLKINILQREFAFINIPPYYFFVHIHQGYNNFVYRL